MSTAQRRTAAVVGAALTLVATSGCFTEEAPLPCDAAAGALVLVVGAHQNAAAPNVPQSLECLLTATVRQRMPISVVGLDGTPEVAPEVRARVFDVRTKNRGALTHDTDVALGIVVKTVRGLTANSD